MTISTPKSAFDHSLYSMDAGIARFEEHPDFELPSEEYQFGRFQDMPVIGPGFDALPPKGVFMIPGLRALTMVEPESALDFLTEHINVGALMENNYIDIMTVRGVAVTVAQLSLDHEDDIYSSFRHSLPRGPVPLTALLEKRVGLCFDAAIVQKITVEYLREEEGYNFEASIDWMSVAKDSFHSFSHIRDPEDPDTWIVADSYGSFSGYADTAHTNQLMDDSKPCNPLVVDPRAG